MDFIDIFNFKKYFKKLGDGSNAKIGHINHLIEKLNEGGSGSGSGSIITIDIDELNSIIQNNEVINGQLYEIKYVDQELYGGTTIYLKGTSNNTLNESGYGKFYNPKYDKNIDGYNLWDVENNYNINDIVHWGGMSWRNTTGNVGENIDLYTLDNNWTLINYNDTDYNVVYDEIKYDINNDLIIYRNEQNTNIVSFNKLTYDIFINDYSFKSPIKSFMWGNVLNYVLDRGIANCNIINSYFENINFKGYKQININFNNLSYQNNIEYHYKCIQNNINFNNNSYQDNIILGYMTRQINLTFNNSFQENIQLLNNSQQYFVSLNNQSFQVNLNFYQSGQNFILLNNGSSFRNFVNDNSPISKITLQNNSTLENIALYNSFISELYITSSQISFNNITYDTFYLKNIIFLNLLDIYLPNLSNDTVINNQYRVHPIEIVKNDINVLKVKYIQGENIIIRDIILL